MSKEEMIMTSDRRAFLKTTGLAGAAAAAGLPMAAAAQIPSPALMGAARSAPPSSEPKPVKGLVLATLRRPNGLVLGVRTDRGILDVAAAEADFREGAPTTMDGLFRGEGNADGLQRLVEKARGSARYFVALDQAEFGPCVTNPEKIICIGLNYRKHIAEMGAQVPKMPVLFSKYNTALNHNGGTIGVSETDASHFDYEAELVIVIGRTTRNVSEADAANSIFGYCTGNDFTARDLQRRSSQWLIGKSLDGSAPVGPWLVTADLADGDNLRIECRVNGELRQSSTTADMVFNCKQLVSYISKYFTLKPGDIIFTGTPEGVIAGYPKDKQVWLKPGDKIVTSIEKLGELSFTLT
jgi:2-keto-4-pentenoate hydratase/2-oxohepta-3-ene-1,7-dioic acid hydratase in catechol pathway